MTTPNTAKPMYVFDQSGEQPLPTGPDENVPLEVPQQQPAIPESLPEKS